MCVNCLRAPQVGAHLGNEGADILCRLAPCLGRVKQTAQAGVGTGLQAPLPPSGRCWSPQMGTHPLHPQQEGIAPSHPAGGRKLPSASHSPANQRPHRPRPGSPLTLDPGSSNGLWLSQPLPPPFSLQQQVPFLDLWVCMWSTTARISWAAIAEETHFCW